MRIALNQNGRVRFVQKREAVILPRSQRYAATGGMVLNLKLATLAAGELLLAASFAYTTESETGYKADAEHGLDLAKRSCASCHVVSAEQQRASVDLPPFAVIAQSPNFNPDRLAHFLVDPHPKMPELPLSRTAADDIAAYIASLKE